MANPETSHEPKYTADTIGDINDTGKIAETIQNEYLAPAKDHTLSSSEVDSLIQKGLAEGIFVHSQSESPITDFDFPNTGQIEGATPQINTEILKDLRDRKSIAIGEEFKDKFHNGVGSKRDSVDPAVALIGELRGLVANGVVDAINVPIKQSVTTRSQGQGSQRSQQTERSVDKPRLAYVDGPSKAVVEAILELKKELNFTPEQNKMYDAEILFLSKEKDSLHKQAKAAGIAAEQQDRMQRDLDAQSARKKLEALETKGFIKNQERAHTAALGQDAEAQAQSDMYLQYETQIKSEPDWARKAQLRVVRDAEMSRVRDELRESRPVITVEGVRQDRLFNAPNAEGGYFENVEAGKKLDEDFEKAEAVKKLAEPSERARQDREILFHSRADSIKYANPDEAHKAALGQDRENAEVSKAYIKFSKSLDRLDAQIKSTPDQSYRLALEEQRPLYVAERDRLVAEEAKRQRDVTFQAVKDLTNVILSSGEKEPNMKRVGPENADFKDIASATRAILQTENIPILETKKGGFFKSRIAEMYLTVPGNDHLIVVERRKNRTGDLISQTVIATEKPLRTRGGKLLPAREVRRQLPDIRKHDERSMKAYSQLNRIGTHVEDTPGKLKEGALKKYFRELSTDNITGSNGVYVKEYGAAPHDAAGQKYSRGSRRRGGFRFWASRGRL